MLLNETERLGFKAPTLVQAQAIPVILSGRHVLVNAATGTGKTVAYLAPVIHHLSLHQPRIQRCDGTFALVLVPTRELCLQVHEILHKLLHRFHWIVPGYVMGGENRDKEKARLRKGTQRSHFCSLFILKSFDFLYKLPSVHVLLPFRHIYSCGNSWKALGSFKEYIIIFTQKLALDNL